ncbi:MAG: ASKHA domain-containing protein [Candidatus Bathyarchaeia archaeon]
MQGDELDNGERENLGKIEIVFLPYGKRGWFAKGKASLLDLARNLGIDLSSLCGGKGNCGKCKVKIEKGVENINPLTKQDLKHLTKEEIKGNYRLACQVKPTGHVLVYVPDRSRVGKQRLQTEGLEIPVKCLNPLVKKYFIELPKPSLEDPRSDEDRLLDTLHEIYGLPLSLHIELDVAANLASVLRAANWKVTVTIWKDTILNVEPGDTTNRCFGFAADIGTTKLAGFLMDLRSGKVIAVSARINPQITLGEDVISRITHQIMGGWNGIRELQKAVVSGINEIIDEVCEKAKVDANDIYELCFAGNTAMQLCLLGIDGRYVAFAPYTPVLRRGINVNAQRLGLKSHPRANCYFLPIIGGFVGADSVADLMVVRILESENIIMDIDIGTNTEIALGNKELVMVDSCASGPAFEGMSIKHGMRAASGAIEKVSIDPETLDVHFRTIDDKPPVGICGSGLIDVLAELLKAGLMDQTGRFVTRMAEQTDRLRKNSEGIWEFVLAWRSETAADIDIVLTQGDIRELQKAKAAMRAGSEILMKRMRITERDIEKLYIAGAFGNYIDPESARIIGIIPEIPLEKIIFVGNTAGTGARMCLISKEEREYAERISEKVKYVELAAAKDFQNEYIKAMYFPHMDLSKYPETVELLRRLGRIK